ncbi:MAG TPA: tRNA (adenosine(37)-N6)-threonylcarbamoyltransferase complex dimerization subunit type 1 TsaB [Tepidisphaeraceae bacterium]|jgi:tRNA threonylcarbamoyladenosine biosynthesis protein TsaB|nr:tRNA (adenosine(37)-N6)-threonylcarbamoyltransferase complex dimerization subunit type 1 TsaB [Tepidisphaeraceae bacterium]
MPRAIAIETSGRVGSIAVVEGEVILTEETFQHGLQNAAQIIPIIDRLTRAQNWSPADVEHLYISIGPGSFTGLRIGVTLAKTMALATGVKIVAVPTVRVLAENAPPEATNLVIVLDAKRDQIFTARFSRQQDRWVEDESARVESLTAMLSRAPRPVLLLGEGIPYHQKFIPSESGVIVTAEQTWRARAGVVATLGMQLARNGKFADPFKLTPTYIRRPEAEEKADAKA